MAANSDDFLVLAYAVFRLGAILVPVSTRLAPPQVGYIVGDSGNTMTVHDDAAGETIAAALAALLRQGAGSLGPSTLRRVPGGSAPP